MFQKKRTATNTIHLQNVLYIHNRLIENQKLADIDENAIKIQGVTITAKNLSIMHKNCSLYVMQKHIREVFFTATPRIHKL